MTTLRSTGYSRRRRAVLRRKEKASYLAGEMGGQVSSSEECREYVPELLSGLEEMSCRKAIGEYILYYRSKTVGGIYNDRFLLEVIPTSGRLLPDAPRAIPYEEAKEVFLIEMGDRETLRDIVDAMWEEVLAPKKSKR